MLIREESASSALAESGSAHIVSGNDAFCTRRRLIYDVVWRRGVSVGIGCRQQQGKVIDMFDALARERLLCASRQSYSHENDLEPSVRTNLYGVCSSVAS